MMGYFMMRVYGRYFVAPVFVLTSIFSSMVEASSAGIFKRTCLAHLVAAGEGIEARLAHESELEDVSELVRWAHGPYTLEAAAPRAGLSVAQLQLFLKEGGISVVRREGKLVAAAIAAPFSSMALVPFKRSPQSRLLLSQTSNGRFQNLFWIEGIYQREFGPKAAATAMAPLWERHPTATFGIHVDAPSSERESEMGQTYEGWGARAFLSYPFRDQPTVRWCYVFEPEPAGN